MSHDTDKYKIIRFYRDHPGRRVTIAKGLTLEQAQEHCRDPETSSRTCSPAKRNKQAGPWFDGYTREL